MDTRGELHQLIRLREQSILSFSEFVEKVLAYLAQFPEQQDDVLARLCDHPNKSVQEAVSPIREVFRKRQESEEAKDINNLRCTSPLQPGTRLTLVALLRSRATNSGRWVC